MALPSVEDVLADLASRGVTLPEGPVNVGSYGDSEALSDELIALIVSGAKRAGTSLVWSHEFDDEPLPSPGNLEVVVDYRGEPVLVTRILTVDVVPFDAVTPDYARIEGEGDGSLEFWRKGHWAFFSRECARIGRAPSPDMRVVCATFDVPLIVPPRLNAGKRGMRALDASPLRLEPLTAGHAREMFAVLSDPAIYEFENEPPASEEALARRYAALERRSSPDGSEAWLNWVVRLPGGELAGYVQATVLANGVAFVAYELHSRYWKQGIATRAVSAMLDELASHYAVRLFVAVLKSRNYRSLALLRKLSFVPANETQRARFHADEDELVMMKAAPHSP